MKISHFPDFLPDETVFSVAGRYLDRMQFHSHSIVSQHFFDSYTKGAVTDLPSSLEHLVQALPPYHVYTADTIIDQHTLFSLYAPFLPFERALTLRQRMKVNGTAVHWIAGIVTSKVPRPQWLRYCPACVGYDRSIYGECYWHRVHQVPGVLVCPIHEIMLEESTANLRLGNNVVQFCSAERSVNNLPWRMIPELLRGALMQLANNVKWMLERSVCIEQGYIRKRYLELLADRGLVTVTGKVRYSKLKEAMSDYYPADLLEDLGCGIVQSKGNWLANWTTIQHPLHHLLFMQFLCQTAHDFFKQSPHSSDPFDNGPWPCLNPLCSHYKKRVIMSYTSRQGNLNRPVATFACLCGFTYSRTGPDTDDEAIFRIGRISQYGDVWDRQLTAYWLDQNIPTSQVARLIQTDVETIRRQAARLGLPFAPDIPRRGKRPKIYNDVIKEQCDVYRGLWEEALKAYSNVGIKKVVRVAPKAYSWLNRHDRDWLREHWPAADPSFLKVERLVLTKIQLKHDNYSLVDADLAKAVRETVEELHARSDFPIQVTRQRLIAQIGDSALLKRSDILPLTSCALDEAIETYSGFIWRKLRWSVRSYLVEQSLPSRNAFLSRAHIGSSTSSRPIIRQLIQIAYNNLKTGTLLSDQMPETHVKFEKGILSENENVETIVPGSLTFVCADKQLMLSDVIARQERKVYDLTSIVCLTVAAVVNGAETCNAIAKWGYQNEDLLHWFGLPEGQFPAHSTLQKIYTQVDGDSFESLLRTWLHETFPLIQSEIGETKARTDNIYIPGIGQLRPYRQIAPEIVAKLR